MVKNVTGFDLPKLMCGAFGTLGPLSEVTLRLVPRAPRALTLAVQRHRAGTGARAYPPRLGAAARSHGSRLRAGLHLPAAFDDAGRHRRRRGADPRRWCGRSAGRKALCVAHHVRRPGRGRRSRTATPLFARLGAGAGFRGSRNAMSGASLFRQSKRPSPPRRSPARNGLRIGRAACSGSGCPATNEASAAKLRHIACARERSGDAPARRCRDARARFPSFRRKTRARAALTRAVKSAFDPHGPLQSRPHVRGRVMRTEFHARAVARARARGCGRKSACLRPLRHLHGDLPDLCALGRRARCPARAHRHDPAHAGRRAVRRLPRPCIISTVVSPASAAARPAPRASITSA